MFKLFKKKNDEIDHTETIEHTTNEKASETGRTAPAEAEDMDELIAVIAAAVAASLNRTTHNIIVRSVKRVPTVSPAWNRAARLDLTEPKLY